MIWGGTMGAREWEWKPWGASTSSQTCYLITSCVTSHEGIFEISSRIHSTRHHQRCNSMLNTFLFSAVHLGMQLNTEQDEVEVAHYKPGEEAGDKLIMETGHLSDLLRGKLCPILTPSPILHPAGPYLQAVQVFLPSTIHIQKIYYNGSPTIFYCNWEAKRVSTFISASTFAHEAVSNTDKIFTRKGIRLQIRKNFHFH